MESIRRNANRFFAIRFSFVAFICRAVFRLVEKNNPNDRLLFFDKYDIMMRKDGEACDICKKVDFTKRVCGKSSDRA